MAQVWNCSACDIPQGGVWPHEDLQSCSDQADNLPCPGQAGKVCGDAPGGEICACYLHDDGRVVWDCDLPPPGF
jgi:hypothetical protein